MGPDTSELQLRNWFGYLQSFKTFTGSRYRRHSTLVTRFREREADYLFGRRGRSESVCGVRRECNADSHASFRCKRRGELCGAPGSNVWRREPVCSSVSAVSFAGSV